VQRISAASLNADFSHQSSFPRGPFSSLALGLRLLVKASPSTTPAAGRMRKHHARHLRLLARNLRASLVPPLLRRSAMSCFI
jgi:hypothetical protein